MSLYFLRTALFVLLFAGLGFSTLRAQQGTSSLRGTIIDPQGSVIPGASVALEDLERAVHLETQTNKSGFYNFPQVAPGTYSLNVSAPNFQALSQKNVVLQVATPAPLTSRFPSAPSCRPLLSQVLPRRS